MLFSRRSKKILAVFLLTVVVGQLMTPTLSYALTAGPTSPEATSFEPVDTTDIVNLQTGDFVYNTPLLEVPGPAGNYPLSLSYHAGILPDQEASWVGLGFTVNPGAITRMVNGYPDDFRGEKQANRVYWQGGETTSQTYGLSYGIANAATVGAGVTFVQDTYKGNSVGGYVEGSVGYRLGTFGNASVSATVGISPYGGSYASIGGSVGLSNGDAHTSVGASLNSDGSFGMNAGVGLRGGVSLLGASISSKGTSPSFSIGGGSASATNNKAGKITTDGYDFNIDIPIWYGVNLRLGESYHRYWIDETVNVATFGALNIPGANPNFDIAFDAYDLLDTSLDLGTFSDPEKVMGGTLPDYDQYSVTGQGIGGNIQPYLYRKQLFRQDKKNEQVVNVKSYPLVKDDGNIPVEFRFLNDFSNRFEYTPPDIQVSGSDMSFDFNEDPTVNTPITGDPDKAIVDSYKDNKLAGSKDVRWYTNAQILRTDSRNPFAEGFIDTNTPGFNRSNDSKAGGFSVTNSSGVTYHYALPVYSFAEYMRNQRFDEKGKLWYNELTKPDKYAYTWLLTSVTGPDFVDKNNDGLADAGDYGYWVRFEYSMWANDYGWRNPGVGFNKDIDGDFEFYSWGRKEIYYLDKIVTESHVAVFEKSERNDGREVPEENKGLGGFSPHVVPGKQSCLQDCANLDYPPQSCFDACNALPDDRLAYPRPTLKLDRIKLFNATDFNSGRTAIANTLRVIDFGYDYSLCSGTPNSYAVPQSDTKLGKLTLTSLNFSGKGGASLIPSTNFSYAKNPVYKKDASDMWGYYKSDYVETDNYNLSKITTPASSGDVDAWSLTDVQLPIGSTLKVEYESDFYEKAILAKQRLLRTKDVTDNGDGQLKISFWESSINLDNYFRKDQIITLDLVGSYNNEGTSGLTCSGTCVSLIKPPPRYESFLFTGDVQISQVDATNGFIIVASNDLYNKIKSETKVATEIIFLEGGKSSTYTLYFGAGQAWPDFFSCGAVTFPTDGETPGGGLRVKSLTTASSGQSKKTSYAYSEGFTSYEPFQIPMPVMQTDFKTTGTSADIALASKVFRQGILNNYSKLLNVSRVIPNPGVMYQNVKVSASVIENSIETPLPNYSVYEFQGFDQSMIGLATGSNNSVQVPGSNYTYQDPTQIFPVSLGYSVIQTSKTEMKDYTSQIGSTKSITLYNTAGAKISSTVNHFLHDGVNDLNAYGSLLSSKFSNQGLIKETFPRAKFVWYGPGEDVPYPIDDEKIFHAATRELYGFVMQKETFPTVQTGQTNFNYKTGITTETSTLAFDFYSGEPTQVLTSDGYGNSFLSVNEPAYRSYPAMGLKGASAANRNMLTQTAASYSFKVDPSDASNRLGLMSASVQTWSDGVPVLGLAGTSSGVWRAQSSYLWDGEQDLVNGVYPYDDFQNNQFNRHDVDQNTSWLKTSEVTLYDIYSHGLEAADVNNNYASTRMDPKQIRVIASTVNARYGETAYSGAEFSSGNSVDEGDVDRGEGSISNLQNHTGGYSLLVGASKSGFNYTLTSSRADLSRKYRVSVWAYIPGAGEVQTEMDNVELYCIVNGNTVAKHPVLQKTKSKNWYLMNLDVVPSGSGDVLLGVRNNSGRGVYFDDFRVHPIDATMTSFVYDSFSGELNYQLDANNIYTHYEYDAMGRLIRTSREQLNNDFGAGNESYKPDRITGEVLYNYGKKN